MDLGLDLGLGLNSISFIRVWDGKEIWKLGFWGIWLLFMFVFYLGMISECYNDEIL